MNRKDREIIKPLDLLFYSVYFCYFSYYYKKDIEQFESQDSQMKVIVTTPSFGKPNIITAGALKKHSLSHIKAPGV